MHLRESTSLCSSSTPSVSHCQWLGRRYLASSQHHEKELRLKKNKIKTVPDVLQASFELATSKDDLGVLILFPPMVHHYVLGFIIRESFSAVLFQFRGLLSFYQYCWEQDIQLPVLACGV